jgi:DNA-binding transcriptional regulator PaaX
MAKFMGKSRLLREVGAREFLGGMSHSALRRLRESGDISVVRIGRAVYYDIEELHRFVDRLSNKA